MVHENTTSYLKGSSNPFPGYDSIYFSHATAPYYLAMLLPSTQKDLKKPKCNQEHNLVGSLLSYNIIKLLVYDVVIFKPFTKHRCSLPLLHCLLRWDSVNSCQYQQLYQPEQSVSLNNGLVLSRPHLFSNYELDDSWCFPCVAGYCANAKDFHGIIK